MVLGNPSLGNLSTQENDINDHWYMIEWKFLHIFIIWKINIEIGTYGT